MVEVTIKTDSTGKIIQGQTVLASALRNMPDQVITITLARKRRRRSISQNRYYWSVIDMVKAAMRQHGIVEDSVTIHEYLKQRFLRHEAYSEKTGEVFTFTGSSTALSTTEFEEYLEQIRQFCAESLSAIIPLPNQQIDAEVL